MPFCTTLTHFKPLGCHGSQRFSEKNLKKIPAAFPPVFA
jgi:hypothetical protein